MPDLAATRGPLRPVHAALLAGDRPSYVMVEAVGPWTADRVAYRLLNPVNIPDVVAGGVNPAAMRRNALLKRVRFDGCDGRARAGVIITANLRTGPDDWTAPVVRIPCLAIVIERSIHHEGSSVTYRLDVAAADQLGRSIDLAQILRLQWWLYALITADVERIVRREIEQGVSFDITTVICGSAKKSVAMALAEWTDLFDRAYVEDVRARIRSQMAPVADPWRRKDCESRSVDREDCPPDPSGDGLEGSPLPTMATDDVG